MLRNDADEKQVAPKDFGGKRYDERGPPGRGAGGHGGYAGHVGNEREADATAGEQDPARDELLFQRRGQQAGRALQFDALAGDQPHEAQRIKYQLCSGHRGSGQRKPASRASVELVFDNTLARAGGQWNHFTEIAVKRVLTRDGTSSYYINNQPVRRRDVQDVFLGTGLGPRAYAIIGQGTISRIIESRPEELRMFLE